MSAFFEILLPHVPDSCFPEAMFFRIRSRKKSIFFTIFQKFIAYRVPHEKLQKKCGYTFSTVISIYTFDVF